MKMHIIYSEWPVEHGTTIIASCGAEVRNAEPIFWIECGGEDVEFSSIVTCPLCLRQPRNFGKEYMSGVVNAQEIRTQNEIDA